MLIRILDKHGITQINPVKEKFDPNYHEALYDYEDASHDAGTIGAVAQVGYKISDRVLRPAKVGIVRSSETESQDSEKK